MRRKLLSLDDIETFKKNAQTITGQSAVECVSFGYVVNQTTDKGMI